METSTSMPIGYRFRPTDQELVSHYLNHKLLGNDSVVNNIIPHVQLLNYAPWDLPALSKVKSEDGYWKITGKDREIKTKGTNIVIGIKKTLVFYGNQHEKTNWVMHQYHSNFSDNKENIVLCRLMEKIEKETQGLTHSSSHAAASIFGNIATMGSIPYVCSSPELNMEDFFPKTPKEEEFSINSMLQGASLENENSIGHNLPEALEKDSADDSSFVDSILDDGVSISEETS